MVDRDVDRADMVRDMADKDRDKIRGKDMGKA